MFMAEDQKARKIKPTGMPRKDWETHTGVGAGKGRSRDRQRRKRKARKPGIGVTSEERGTPVS